MAFKNQPIKALKRATYNPKSRQRDINTLVSSIERVGLINPVVVTKDGQVVDGHRRIAACEKLGWTDVMTNVVEGDPAELYSEVSSSVRAMSGNETLSVYLKEPAAVGPKVRGRISLCEDAVGRGVLRKMASGGFSISTWDVAKRICRLADQSTPAMLRKTVEWLIQHRCGGQVKANLQGGADVGGIVRAINRNKPITTKVEFVS